MFNRMTDRVDINEWVAPKSNNTQNVFGFKKRVLVTTVPQVAASFLLITYARPIAVGLGGGAPWWGRAMDFATSLFTAFDLREHAVIRCSGLPQPHALVGSYSTLKCSVIGSSTLCTELCRAYRMVLRRSGRRFLLVNTLTRSSSLKPLLLLVDWVQGS